MTFAETELGREVRKNTKRIVAELTRIHDRYENADWAGIRPADAKIAADTITRLEEERAACTCEAHRPAFEIPERDDGAHAPRIFAAIARFNAVGAGQ